MSKQTRIRQARAVTNDTVKTMLPVFSVAILLTGLLSIAAGNPAPVIAAGLLTAVSFSLIRVLHAIEERRIRRSKMP